MSKWMLLTMCAVLGVSVAQAAITAGDLTPEALQQAVAGKPRAEQRQIVKQTLEAIASMPMDSNAKLEALVSAARALIGGGKTADVIAEVFNSMPIEYLPAVANLLAEANFDQDIQDGGKPWPNKQFDDFSVALVKSVARYIEVSGTDSPALRIGILTATFTKASNDPARTMPQVIAALPPSMQAAAETYVNAQLNDNLAVIAEAAGVDEVEPTPAVDPNADRVVSANDTAATTTEASPADATTGVTDTAAGAEDAPLPAEMDYLASPDPADAGSDTETADQPSDASGETPDVKVPMLSRYTSDILGITLDTALSTMYDWEDTGLMPGNVQPGQPGFGMEPIPGLDQQIPTGAGGQQLDTRPLPSPGYGNQYF